MYRVYLGNLTKQVSEQTLSQVFEENGLTARNIMVKDSYAFVDCPDQDSVNKAIERLQGLKINGLPMQVEPAFARQRNGTSRLVIHSMPSEADEGALRDLLSPHGTVRDLSLRPEADGSGNVVMVTFASPEQAQQAKEKLDSSEFQGTRLKVGFASRQVEAAQYHHSNGYAPMAQVQKGADFPLRLLIPGQSVGAIIGRSGQTIRSITQKTKARIDVLRHDSFMSAEKVVVILSSHTQNCIDACIEILKILNQEPAPGAPRESELRMLAPNNLCGRLIGRQGTVIRGMMEETNAVITVSVVGNVSYNTPDRMISIKGSLESVCLAADRVYSKLKAAYESDVKNVKYGPQVYYGGNTMVMLPTTMVPAATPTLPMQQWYTSPVHYQPGPWMQQSMTAPVPLQHFDWPGNYAPSSMQTCYVYVPKAAVGSIIGAKGSFINFLKTQIHATCQVLEKSEEAGVAGGGSCEGDTSDVPIKVTGTPDAVWRAQTYIFEKIKTEGFSGNEPAKLRCDIFVPKVRVGRLIGKGGQNVRHIQAVSDAAIRVQGFGGNDKESVVSPQSPQDGNAEARVQITGNICAQTIAQSLIRQLLVSVALQHPMYGAAMSSGPGAALAPAAAAAATASATAASPTAAGSSPLPEARQHQAAAPAEPGLAAAAAAEPSHAAVAEAAVPSQNGDEN